MSRLFIGILFLLSIASCQKETLPKGVVPQKLMVPLLFDFHLAEGYISSLPLDSSRLMARNYYHAVFKKYGTDSARFHQSLMYYSKQPGVMNQIYTEVQKRLQTLQQTEQAKLDSANRKVFLADSLRSAQVKDSIFRLATDSLYFKLSKYLIYRPKPGDSSVRRQAWSLPVYEAWVGSMLFIKGKTEEVNRLLSPRSTRTEEEKRAAKDEVTLRSPH